MVHFLKNVNFDDVFFNKKFLQKDIKNLILGFLKIL